MKNISFNEDQIDALRELINISLGEATSHVAELLDAFGTIHIPNVSVRDTSELKEIIIENIDSELDIM